MAKFLNTDLINEWLPRLISETQRELVIIVPYIKTPDRIYQHLLDANRRGVETTLIYRENHLLQQERAKFEALDNLNLMHHPNVHAKCYYNETYLIICSMNLYEYSSKNNREMGILLHRNSIDGPYGDRDDEKLFLDAVKEIRSIINGAHIERASRETDTEGFEMEIIKTQKEKEEENCRFLNKHFGHKRFEVVQRGDKWSSICHNYFDKIHLVMEHRATLVLDLEEGRKEELFRRIAPKDKEFRFPGYKFYWNWHKSDMHLYPDTKHPLCKDLSGQDELHFMRKGVDELISFIRQYY